MTTNALGRRHAIAGAAGLGLGLPVLSACGGDEAAVDPAASGGGGGETLGPVSDVPVGGGTVFADQEVVVTQAGEGEFKAFSAVCTHQGCLVGQVDGDQIQCPCHGSVFSAADGSVVKGPATSPLEAVEISVDGDQITLA